MPHGRGKSTRKRDSLRKNVFASAFLYASHESNTSARSPAAPVRRRNSLSRSSDQSCGVK